MSIIKEAFCSKLVDEFDTRARMLYSLTYVLDGHLRGINNQLKSFAESPVDIIAKLKTDIDSNLNTMVPSLTEFDELVYLINECLFTRNDPMLSRPSTLMRGIKNNLKRNTFPILNEIAKVGYEIIPEFSVASLVNELKDQLGTSKVNKLVPEAIQALNCMSAICGTNITSRVEYLNSFLSAYSISSTGELDFVKILESQGISASGIDQITQCVEMIDDVMEKIENSVSGGLDRLKTILPDLDCEC